MGTSSYVNYHHILLASEMTRIDLHNLLMQHPTPLLFINNDTSFFCQCFSSIWISFVGPPHYTTRHPLCINFRLQHLIAKSNLELMVKKRWCSNQCCNGVQLAGLLLGFKSRYLWLRHDLTPSFFLLKQAQEPNPGY